MYPILYEKITPGTVPQTHGLGTLSDALSTEIEHVGNGIYELVMEYPITGIHAQEIAYRRVIKAKPNFTDDPQLFRIARVGKVMNGSFTVYARHISYDLSGCEITSGTAGNAVAAAALLQAAAPNYTITTDKTVSATFKIDEPGSVKSYFVGREGSFLDVYGKTEIKYDNFSVQFLLNAGQDRGVTINYGKNLLELSQEIDASNLYTHVRCFYKQNDEAAIVGNKVATGLTLDVDRCLIVDVTQEYQEAPSVSTLTTRAQQYISNNNLTVPSNNITLNFAQGEQLKDRVDLFDMVSVYYEALGITRTSMKCIRTKWDCIKEKYIEVELGDAKTDVTDTIALNNKAIANTPSTSFMQEAISHATELITGNLGGYVINGHDSNGDGFPDENLIMNTPDINTATKVIRSNLGGIGFSTNGYEGPFTTAINYQGIVADAITTGTLNANLIKAGVLSDAQGNSSINMTNGSAVMNEFKSKMKFSLINASDVSKADFYINGGDTVLAMRPSSSSKDLIKMWAQDANGAGVFQLLKSNGNLIVESGLTSEGGGGIGIRNSSNVNIGEFRTNDYGGAVTLKNNRGNSVCEMNAASAGDGVFQLRNSIGNVTIYGFAQSGDLVCVTLYQTSSRKVKKNIEPIKDSMNILELQAVKFDYKDENQGADKRGFIAEDVAEILPNLVTPEKDGRPATLDYISMIPYLQDVIKQQQKQIEDLTKRVESLEKGQSK